MSTFDSYKEFQKYMAFYGFTESVLTENQFKKCCQYDKDTVYGIACDMNTGDPFVIALENNLRN